MSNLPSDIRSRMTRRSFAQRALRTSAGLAALTAGLPLLAQADTADDIAVAAALAKENPKALPQKLLGLLSKSPFAYISPLKSDRKESQCHAELWYAWIDDAVVVTVATDRWKATALRKGLDRARIWVGDHGIWNTWYGGHNEDFRAAPSFEARGERVRDTDLLERLLAIYEKKYPAEIAQWREPMRTGNADGSRIVIRYTPIG